MDGILICGALLIAIVLLRQRGQEWDSVAYAPVRVDVDDSTADVICGGSLSLLNHSALSSDDDWPNSCIMDDSLVAGSYGSGINMDTNRWMDPMFAYEVDNMYHNTPMDPTYHDDSVSSFDDSCSNLFDDSSLSSGFDDSFSSSNSFDD